MRSASGVARRPEHRVPARRPNRSTERVSGPTGGADRALKGWGPDGPTPRISPRVGCLLPDEEHERPTWPARCCAFELDVRVRQEAPFGSRSVRAVSDSVVDGSTTRSSSPGPAVLGALLRWVELRGLEPLPPILPGRVDHVPSGLLRSSKPLQLRLRMIVNLCAPSGNAA